jgi:hypothetical protein
MSRHLYDPREVMAGAPTAPLRQVWQALTAAVLVCAVLGTPALVAWAENLPVGPLGDGVLELAARWHDAMAWLGLDRPYEAIRRAVQAFRMLR